MNEKLRVLDLFSGIGGFSLGLKRAGFRTVGYCEIDPYCQQVLQARMQDGSLDSAPICTDVRSLDGGPWRGCVEVICGGFPCQDISLVGKRAGIEGQRSGLWREIIRLIGEVRPRFVLVENVSALLGRGIGRVLGDLAASGYDAEWECLPASSFGANHQRDRVWIVAYPWGERLQGKLEGRSTKRATGRSGREHPDLEPVSVLRRVLVQHPPGPRLRVRVPGDRGLGDRSVFETSARLQAESGICGVAHGVSGRVDRLRGLGNSVYPDIVEWIGRRILEVA